MIIAETCQSKDLLELRGICEFGDWLPRSSLVGRGKKSARGRRAWCKQPEQLKFLFFVNKK